MKVSEVINRLKVGDTVWVKGEVLDFDRGCYDHCPLEVSLFYEDEWIHENDEITLTEPQAEKVEVTERQAQLLEAYEGETLYALLGECNEYEQELLAKAKLFGYTVKPKRWVIKNTDGDTCYLKRFRIGDDCIDGESSGWIGERVWAFTFDDRAKAEAVATLVEGTVEEV